MSANLHLVPATIDLAAADVELAGVVGREVILREALAADPADFDFLLMDCGPSLGVLTLNALAAADEVFIPLQPHFLALHGLSKLLETTALVSRRINPGLTVTGVVVCLFDGATRLAHEVVADLKGFLDKSRGAAVPWRRAKVFDTRIRRNVKLAECPSFGVSILEYAPGCAGAKDYAALANEVLGAVVVEPAAAEPGRRAGGGGVMTALTVPPLLLNSASPTFGGNTLAAVDAFAWTRCGRDSASRHSRRRLQRTRCSKRQSAAMWSCWPPISRGTAGTCTRECVAGRGGERARLTYANPGLSNPV